MQTKGAEIQIADRLLKGVLGQLLHPDANMADHVEGNLPNAGGLRLQGKLRLCAALIRVLKRYSVGARSGGGLIEKLLIGECKHFYDSGMHLLCVQNGCCAVLLNPASSGCAGHHVWTVHQSWSSSLHMLG